MSLESFHEFDSFREIVFLKDLKSFNFSKLEASDSKAVIDPKTVKMAALNRLTLQVKSSNRRRSSILFSKLSDAGLSEVLNSSLLDTASQTDENQNIEQTLSDLEFYYGLGEMTALDMTRHSAYSMLVGAGNTCKCLGPKSVLLPNSNLLVLVELN